MRGIQLPKTIISNILVGIFLLQCQMIFGEQKSHVNTDRWSIGLYFYDVVLHTKYIRQKQVVQYQINIYLIPILQVPLLLLCLLPV